MTPSPNNALFCYSDASVEVGILYPLRRFLSNGSSDLKQTIPELRALVSDLENAVALSGDAVIAADLHRKATIRESLVGTVSREAADRASIALDTATRQHADAGAALSEGRSLLREAVEEERRAELQAARADVARHADEIREHAAAADAALASYATAIRAALKAERAAQRVIRQRMDPLAAVGGSGVTVATTDAANAVRRIANDGPAEDVAFASPHAARAADRLTDAARMAGA